MKCSRIRKRIALHAEGDLSRRKAARVDEHLTACSGCREFAADLAASQAALKESAAPEVDDAVFADIRRGALARIEASGRRPARRFVWVWAVPAAAAAIAVAILAMPRPAPLPPPPEVARIAPPPESVKPAAQPLARRARPRPRPRPVVLAAKPEPLKAEPLLVKLETEDPNVVIYWIVESTGESQ